MDKLEIREVDWYKDEGEELTGDKDLKGYRTSEREPKGKLKE